MKTRLIRLAFFALLLSILNPQLSTVCAQGTAFTYQGRLTDGGLPATGLYDFVFTVYDDESAGNQLGLSSSRSDIPVTNGLFTVEIDPGAGVFTGPPRFLEIKVQKTGVGFTTLVPRQAITPTPYSIRALTAGGVAGGSITSASIAPSGLSGSVIQPGTVTSNLLAPGAVNLSALQSPYQSGRIALEAFTPADHFGATLIHQAVTFPNSFASAPTITASLETGSRAVAEVVPPILVSGKTTTGFTATFTVKSVPVTVANNADPYFYAGFPLLVVNGRPAAAFNQPSLSYARAQDSLGQRWQAATTLAPLEAAHIDLAIVNGNPAIAFAGQNSLQYVRATDSDGTNWPVPIIVKSVSPGVFTANVVSLADIAGRPAIVCWNSVSNNLYYFRADDSNGDAWSGDGLVVATGSHFDFQLADVSGNPAVAYSWDNGLAYNDNNYNTRIRLVRALDATGGSWPASPVDIASFGVLHFLSQTRLLMLGTSPAVAFTHTAGYNDYEVAVAKANDSSGSGWPSPTVVNFNPSYPAASLSFTFVNGKPALAWFDAGWNYAESGNGGVSFLRYFIDVTGGSRGTLADVQGKPALTMMSNGDVGYLRDATPILDSYINWIAVQP